MQIPARLVYRCECIKVTSETPNLAGWVRFLPCLLYCLVCWIPDSTIHDILLLASAPLPIGSVVEGVNTRLVVHRVVKDYLACVSAHTATAKRIAGFDSLSGPYLLNRFWANSDLLLIKPPCRTGACSCEANAVCINACGLQRSRTLNQ